MKQYRSFHLLTVFTFNTWALPDRKSVLMHTSVGECSNPSQRVVDHLCGKDDSRSLQRPARNKTETFPLGSPPAKKKVAVGLRCEFSQAAPRHSPAPLLQKGPSDEGKPGLAGVWLGAEDCMGRGCGYSEVTDGCPSAAASWTSPQGMNLFCP